MSVTVSEEKAAELQKVREAINAIDAQIVSLIAQRGELVKRAGDLKPTPEAVFDPERLMQILLKVRALAEEKGANPDLVEELFLTMVIRFTRLEQTQVAERLRAKQSEA